MKGRATMTGLSALLLLAACGGGGDLPADNATVASPIPVETPVVVAATPAASEAPVPPAAAEEQSLQAFWAKFREAALANDAAGIAALSAPVVMQHGIMDDSPKYRLTPAKAAAVLLKMLDDPNTVDDEGRTNRQLLKATPNAPLDSGSSPDRLRVGDMEFAHGATGWRLDLFYYEP